MIHLVNFKVQYNPHKINKAILIFYIVHKTMDIFNKVHKINLINNKNKLNHKIKRNSKIKINKVIKINVKIANKICHNKIINLYKLLK